MKKASILITLLLIAALIVSCAKETPGEIALPKPTESETSQETVVTEYPFAQHTVGTFFLAEDDGGFPENSVICSSEELTEFISSYQDTVYLGGGEEDYGSGPWFLDLCETYDDAFFAEKDLIILLEGGPPSVDHIITGLTQAKDEWTVSIDVIVPLVLEDAISEYLIVIEADTDKTIKATDWVTRSQNVIEEPDGGFAYMGLNAEYPFISHTLPTSRFENDIHPKNTAITSAAELAAYIEENRGIVSLGGADETLVDTPTFLELCEKYDDAFFAEKDLIVCFVNYPPTCTPVPKATLLSHSGELWEVTAEITANGGDEAEGDWLIVIETDTDKTIKADDRVTCFLEIIVPCHHE